MTKLTADKGETTVGSYFVANYPPFTLWTEDQLDEAKSAIHQTPRSETPLGVYLHIPFCRRRCRFCYFRVYTDKNAQDIERYIAALAKEIELYSRTPAVSGRRAQFLYFGGGTPSYLSEKQLAGLADRLRRSIPWDGAEEVTFECEPGTLKPPKLRTIREIGVTRLSLGIENLDDHILEENGRAHLSRDAFRAYEWARAEGFPQINLDLIAGMAGETWDRWRETVRRTLEMQPDSLTIYQMELPLNTVYARSGGDGGALPISDWETKRAWMDYAFEEFRNAGYATSSAYTVVKDPRTCRFIYRDSLWHGGDMLGTGVASFGHMGGAHYQNEIRIEDYIETVEEGRLPLARAMRPTPRQLFIRELILQMKLGRLDLDYFRNKFRIDPREEFAETFAQLAAEGYVQLADDRVEATRTGLLRIDGLLPRFFEPDHLKVRYA